MIHIAMTGGSGYLGTILLEALSRLPIHVDVLDLRPPLGRLKEGWRYIPINLVDQEAVRQIADRYDVVVHLAGLVGFPACQKDPEEAVKRNLVSTENLLGTVRSDCQFLFASTVSNYGSGPVIVNETTPLKASTLYSETKIAAEKLVWARPGSTVFRFASSFGCSPRMRDDLLVHDFVQRALAGEVLKIFEADFSRSLIHVRDMADTIIFAIENAEKVKDQIINIGDPISQITKRELAEKIARLIPFSYSTDETGADPERRTFHVSFEKMIALGLRPTRHVDDLLPEIVSHYQDRLVKTA